MNFLTSISVATIWRMSANSSNSMIMKTLLKVHFAGDDGWRLLPRLVMKLFESSCIATKFSTYLLLLFSSVRCWLYIWQVKQQLSLCNGFIISIFPPTGGRNDACYKFNSDSRLYSSRAFTVCAVCQEKELLIKCSLTCSSTQLTTK